MGLADEYLAFVTLGNLNAITRMFDNVAVAPGRVAETGVKRRLDIFEAELIRLRPTLAAALDQRDVQPAIYAGNALSVGFIPLRCSCWASGILPLWERIIMCRDSGELDLLLARTAVAVLLSVVPRLEEIWAGERADEFEQTCYTLMAAFSTLPAQICQLLAEVGVL